MIDLRSDTVTKPSEAMRSVIANAEVGDDVYHDDPNVNLLEQTVADLLGKEEAMFVPTGTMSNQIAVRVNTQPGDTVILHTTAHIASHELGGAAHTSGVTLRGLDNGQGAFTPEQLIDAVPTLHPALPSHLNDPVTLVCLENTHDGSGGRVWDPTLTADVLRVAKDLGLATHLDGARLWNAEAASGISLADLSAGFDTVNVCFSKGLGAPIGSALAGSSETISKARRFKHMFGGGFRQAGLIAAGALYALEHNRSRLVDDHANARLFAETVNEAKGVDVDLSAVQTNVVYFNTRDAESLVDACIGDSVAMLALGRDSVRAVFHLDISGDDAETAARIVRSAAEGLG